MSKLARNTDPQTSHDAAARVGEFSCSHQQLILSCLDRHGPIGAEGISAIIGIPSYSIRKRLPELQDMNYCFPTGNMLRTSSGRQEREWNVP